MSPRSKRKSGKMRQNVWIPVTLIFAVGGTASYLLGQAGAYLPSGLCLMAAAVALFFVFYHRSRQLLDMEALFSLFWLGGTGVSCLKLSRLATEWTDTTWLCFALAYVGMIVGYEWLKTVQERKEKRTPEGETAGKSEVGQKIRRFHVPEDPAEAAKRLKWCILVTTGVSLACFVFEAAVLGFLPILSDKPHAYSEFHISGVHYFTITCVMVPALCVLYREQICRMQGKLDKKHWLFIGVCSGIALLIPICSVSRFQLIFSLVLAMIVWIRVSGKVKLKYILILIAVMVPLYVGLTAARNHDVEYLNGIFEMKNENTPIFITQPYMYIANNYDNFNCLVEQLPAHTHGMRMAFPLIVFTGMKFVHPEWVNYPIYVTKTELTTVTLIYDAYYDFGVIGVAAFALILGILCRAIARLAEKDSNPIAFLLYGQAALYLMLSFFTTWYSNPTTWFWYGVTVLYALVLAWPEKKRG